VKPLWDLALLAVFFLACGRMPVPPPAANNACVAQCQQTHALCLQGTGAPAQAYGDSSAALVGGLIQLAISQSGRSRCSQVLESCYGTCGQAITAQQATAADACSQLRCPNGNPGLWMGKARTLGLEVAIAVYMCRVDQGGGVSGQWRCAPLSSLVQCVTEGGSIDGRIDGDVLRLVSAPLPGGRVSRCEFIDRSGGNLRLVGNYSCSGNVNTSGTFELNRCP
jgi:hypothetical protein